MKNGSSHVPPTQLKSPASSMRCVRNMTWERLSCSKKWSLQWPSSSQWNLNCSVACWRSELGKYTVKLLFHQSLRCTVTTWWLDSDGIVNYGQHGDWAANGSVVTLIPAVHDGDTTQSLCSHRVVTMQCSDWWNRSFAVYEMCRRHVSFFFFFVNSKN